jgi:hypothetical protein
VLPKLVTSRPQHFGGPFMRAVDLARHVGISRPHFYKTIARELTKYEIAGVPVFSVAEAEALVRPRTTPLRQTPRKLRVSAS